MRYDYRCAACGKVIEVIHAICADPEVRCPTCSETMHRVINLPGIVTKPWHGRSARQPDRPSNKEYQAYKRWEAAGGEPGTYEHRQYLAARGEEE